VPRTFRVSAELDPKNLPDKSFDTIFARVFHRNSGVYAAYGYEAMGLVLQAIAGAGTDASSFRDTSGNGVFGAHRDGTVLGSYAITSDGNTTECMIQRYRLKGSVIVPLGAPCPPPLTGRGRSLDHGLTGDHRGDQSRISGIRAKSIECCTRASRKVT